MAIATRLCLIGCGYMARSNHAPAQRALADAGAGIELVACCDLDLERAQKLQAAAGYARAYADAATMLDAERPDAVCIAVPDTAMAQTAQLALERGIPALLEKPPARTLAELDALIELSQRKGVLTQVAFNRRFMPTTLEFKRRLGGGTPPQVVQGVMARDRRLDADFTTTAIHLIDTVRAVLDDDYSELHLRYHQAGGVTNYTLHGISSRGVLVQLSICPSAGTCVERITAHCDSRTLELDMAVPGRESEHCGSVREWTRNQLVGTAHGDVLARSREPYALSGVLAENAAFLHAVQQGVTDSSVTLQASRQSLQIMLALRERCPDWRAT